MQTLILLLLVANLAALVWLGTRQLRMRALLAQLQQSTTDLEPLHAQLDEATKASLARSGNTVISVEILNPLEVAARESWLAGRFGGVAPGLIRREVYRQALSIMDAQLRDYGIEPRLQLHGRQ